MPSAPVAICMAYAPEMQKLRVKAAKYARELAASLLVWHIARSLSSKDKSTTHTQQRFNLVVAYIIGSVAVMLTTRRLHTIQRFAVKADTLLAYIAVMAIVSFMFCSFSGCAEQQVRKKLTQEQQLSEINYLVCYLLPANRNQHWLSISA